MASYHGVEIVLVTFLVIDFDSHVVPLISEHFVACGKKRIETEDPPVALVVEVSTAIFGPLSLQRSRRDGDLIGRRAHRGFEVNPIGVRRNIMVVTCGHVIDARHAVFVLQVMLASIGVFGKLRGCDVANPR